MAGTFFAVFTSPSLPRTQQPSRNEPDLSDGLCGAQACRVACGSEVSGFLDKTQAYKPPDELRVRSLKDFETHGTNWPVGLLSLLQIRLGAGPNQYLPCLPQAISQH